MITCICHNVNDKTITKHCELKKINSIADLKKEILICTQCKKCAPEIKVIIQKIKKEETIDSFQYKS